MYEEEKTNIPYEEYYQENVMNNERELDEHYNRELDEMVETPSIETETPILTSLEDDLIRKIEEIHNPRVVEARNDYIKNVDRMKDLGANFLDGDIDYSSFNEMMEREEDYRDSMNKLSLKEKEEVLTNANKRLNKFLDTPRPEKGKFIPIGNNEYGIETENGDIIYLDKESERYRKQKMKEREKNQRLLENEYNELLKRQEKGENEKAKLKEKEQRESQKAKQDIINAIGKGILSGIGTTLGSNLLRNLRR